MNPDNQEFNVQLQQRLKELPTAVQAAITSADVEAHLRELATAHKLHLDQWQLLENEVMLTLLGFEQPEDLASNIQQEIGVPAGVAQVLAADVSRIVFEPIRQQLERNLEHPEAREEAVSDTEAARTQILGTEHGESAPPEPAAPSVQPATPPTPVPDVKIARPTEASAYKPGEASHERTSIHDDPYREPPA